MNRVENYSYKGFKPIPEFSKFNNGDKLAALIVLLLQLESQVPGTISHVLALVSLIDGGFRMRTGVREECSAHAMQSQKDLLEVIKELNL